MKEVKIMPDLSRFSLFLRPSLPVNPGYTRVTDSNNQADEEVFLCLRDGAVCIPLASFPWFPVRLAWYRGFCINLTSNPFIHSFFVLSVQCL